MRLGTYACALAPGSLAQRIYGGSLVHERHRHRYEFNCLYERPLTEHGFRISGRSPDGKFVEIAELPGHPWYLAVQFHPEFRSKPTHPHPLFASFVEAAYRHTTAAIRDRAATESVGLTRHPVGARVGADIPGVAGTMPIGAAFLTAPGQAKNAKQKSCSAKTTDHGARPRADPWRRRQSSNPTAKCPIGDDPCVAESSRNNW